MLKLHAAGPDFGEFASFVEAVGGHAQVQLVGTSGTLAHTAEVLKGREIDVLLFPFGWADAIRTLKVSQTPKTPDPSLVVVADQASTPVLARSLACGFDGAVDSTSSIENAVEKMTSVVRGQWTLADEPSLRGLGLSPGLLARDLIITDREDQHIADLVGTGLTDEDIAYVMGWTVQRVRNHIESILSLNNISYRTQLAVIRASLLKVPDFS